VTELSLLVQNDDDAAFDGSITNKWGTEDSFLNQICVKNNTTVGTLDLRDTRDSNPAITYLQ
jgi:hypothetical protein